MDYADEWIGEYSRSSSIWEETDVIGVSGKIMNEVIAVNTLELDSALIETITQVFINIAQTTEGSVIFDELYHLGYVRVNDEDFDCMRDALALFS